mmetsp:Transcript_18150/g.50802  ORF Transcript_18150/g.50802 Transcript_18150/m.50802 type:complete len:235 (+) Transcript_18150:936-1640(+)
MLLPAAACLSRKTAAPLLNVQLPGPLAGDLLLELPPPPPGASHRFWCTSTTRRRAAVTRSQGLMMRRVKLQEVADVAGTRIMLSTASNPALTRLPLGKRGQLDMTEDLARPHPCLPWDRPAACFPIGALLPEARNDPSSGRLPPAGRRPPPPFRLLQVAASGAAAAPAGKGGGEGEAEGAQARLVEGQVEQLDAQGEAAGTPATRAAVAPLPRKAALRRQLLLLLLPQPRPMKP